MGIVYFVGLGLDSEKGMSLEGLETTRKVASVFAEFYTNLMPNLDLRNLENMIGKHVTLLARSDLEDDEGKMIATAAEDGDAVLLVPGDPMVATTHVALRLSFARLGVETRIIHGASIVSAICGATGLQNYKFGRSVTVPFEKTIPPSVTDVIIENKRRGLHTLVFFDIRTDQTEQLTIPKFVRMLEKNVPDARDWLAVGIARLGGPDQAVHASKSLSLLNYEFGPPPQTIVFPSRLHFMEAEALKVFCGANEEDLRSQQ